MDNIKYVLPPFYKDYASANSVFQMLGIKKVFNLSKCQLLRLHFVDNNKSYSNSSQIYLYNLFSLFQQLFLNYI